MSKDVEDMSPAELSQLVREIKYDLDAAYVAAKDDADYFRRLMEVYSKHCLTS